MRAMIFEAHGDLDQLHLKEMHDPEVGPTDVRVRVKAVALNHLDIWVRKGWAGLRLEMPHILGSDVAGVVDTTGERVEGIKPGDEVVVGPGLSCGRCGECLSGRDNRCRHYRLIGEHVRG